MNNCNKFVINLPILPPCPSIRSVLSYPPSQPASLPPCLAASLPASSFRRMDGWMGGWLAARLEKKLTLNFWVLSCIIYANNYRSSYV